MIFKDLKKRVSLETSQQQHPILFKRLQDKPFWIWNIEEHKQEDIKKNEDCCFNHIIGLPVKEGVQKPFFDYEKLLYDSIFSVNDVLDNNDKNNDDHSFKHKHLWVKKATGLGVTEFFLG